MSEGKYLAEYHRTISKRPAYVIVNKDGFTTEWLWFEDLSDRNFNLKDYFGCKLAKEDQTPIPLELFR